MITPSNCWRRFFGLLTMLSLWLAAFWIVLGHQFSAETYLTRPVAPDLVEFYWFGIGLVEIGRAHV